MKDELKLAVEEALLSGVEGNKELPLDGILASGIRSSGRNTGGFLG